MSSDNQLLIATLSFGAFLVSSGLGRFRRKRLIEDTPTSKIRSAALGVVELCGVALPRRPTIAPLSRRPACWWIVSIQEERQSGKSRSWVTVARHAMEDAFYIDDATGRLLIDPQRAEIDPSTLIVPMNGQTTVQHFSLLQEMDFALRVASGTWRIVEEAIYTTSPLYVLGDLVRLNGADGSFRESLMARLRSAKNDPEQMRAADANADGVVDANEWDAFRGKLEDELRSANAVRESEALLVRAPVDRPFIIAVQDEKGVLTSFRWKMIGMLFFGPVLTGVGLFIAFTDHVHPMFVIACLLAGALFGAYSSSMRFIKSYRL